jgi:hypothetical protein
VEEEKVREYGNIQDILVTQMMLENEKCNQYLTA